MANMMTKIEEIMCENPGKIYSIHDFYDLGTKNTIKSILYRLNEEGKITRLMDGLYTKPKYSHILDEYSYPTAQQVAEKLAEKFSWTIAPTNETALNYVGISTQVPNEYVYISDGAYRTYDYRNKKIIFKHTSNRNIKEYSKELSILIQAIIAIGKDKINEEDIKKMASFSKNIEENLNKDTNKLPFWIKDVLLKIDREKNDE